jgi:hypothetical protein
MQTYYRHKIKIRKTLIVGVSLLLGFLIGCLAVAGIVGGLTYFFKEMDSPERTEKRKKAKADGLEFGKTTDQNGCMEKAYLLESTSDRFDLSNEAFDESCLNASRPTPNFCEGVPLLFKRDWVNEQCKKVGHDTTSCYAAFSEKIDFCRTDGKKLNQ